MQGKLSGLPENVVQEPMEANWDSAVLNRAGGARGGKKMVGVGDTSSKREGDARELSPIRSE